MGGLHNRCAGTGEQAVMGHNGIGYQCPRCGMQTIPYPNGTVRKHGVLAQQPIYPLSAGGEPAPPPAEKMREALQRIWDDGDDCQCEHDDEDCCALTPDYCCPVCIAAHALGYATFPAAVARPALCAQLDNESDGTAVKVAACQPSSGVLGPVGHSALPQTLADAAEMLWVVLANVSGGNWKEQSADWQEAAARWRDNYFAVVRAAAVPASPPAADAAQGGVHRAADGSLAYDHVPVVEEVAAPADPQETEESGIDEQQGKLKYRMPAAVASVPQPGEK